MESKQKSKWTIREVLSLCYRDYTLHSEIAGGRHRKTAGAGKSHILLRELEVSHPRSLWANEASIVRSAMGAIQQFFQVFSFYLLRARHDQVTCIGKKKKANGNAVCHICKDASMSQHTLCSTSSWPGSSSKAPQNAASFCLDPVTGNGDQTPFHIHNGILL